MKATKQVVGGVLIAVPAVAVITFMLLWFYIIKL